MTAVYADCRTAHTVVRRRVVILTGTAMPGKGYRRDSAALAKTSVPRKPVVKFCNGSILACLLHPHNLTGFRNETFPDLVLVRPKSVSDRQGLSCFVTSVQPPDRGLEHAEMRLVFPLDCYHPVPTCRNFSYSQSLLLLYSARLPPGHTMLLPRSFQATMQLTLPAP